MIKGQASGKVILFGEYAVLEGAPALVLASKARASARYISPSNQWKPSLKYLIEAVGDGLQYIDQNEPVSTVDIKQHKFPFARAVLEQCNAPRGHYQIDTRDFRILMKGEYQKLGLGSSAAATASLIDLLQKNQMLTDTKSSSSTDRFILTQSIHHQVQGSLGSGADVAAACLGGLHVYRWQSHDAIESSVATLCTPFSKEELPPEQAVLSTGRAYWQSLAVPDWPLFAVWVGQSASTTKLVRSVMTLKQQSPTLYFKHLQTISHATAQAMTALRHQSLEQFANAVERGGQAVKALGTSAGVHLWTPAHQRLETLCKSMSATIKSTGAGGGDLALITLRSPSRSAELEQRLRETGWFYFRLNGSSHLRS